MKFPAQLNIFTKFTNMLLYLTKLHPVSNYVKLLSDFFKKSKDLGDKFVTVR